MFIYTIVFHIIITPRELHLTYGLNLIQGTKELLSILTEESTGGMEMLDAT